MCSRGSWRSFDTQWLQDRLSAIQQCTECGEHRAKVIEDAPVVGVKEGSRREDIPQEGTEYAQDTDEDRSW
jgi:hypothetical protein